MPEEKVKKKRKKSKDNVFEVSEDNIGQLGDWLGNSLDESIRKGFKSKLSSILSGAKTASDSSKALGGKKIERSRDLARVTGTPGVKMSSVKDSLRVAQKKRDKKKGGKRPKREPRMTK